MNTYAFPSALWVASATGLFLMLVGDGALDFIGLALLLWPLIAIARHSLR